MYCNQFGQADNHARRHVDGVVCRFAAHGQDQFWENQIVGGFHPQTDHVNRRHGRRAAAGIGGVVVGRRNANDSAGGNNGELAGSATYDKGQVGQAFAFDGTRGSSVKVGNPVQLQLQDFTIAAWIKRGDIESVSVDSPNAVLFGYGLGGYALYLNPGGALILSKYNVRGGETKSRAAIKDTDWHHVAVTKSGSTVVFYVDGVAHPAPAYDVEYVFSTEAAIGASGKNSVLSFWGLMDEVGIYDRALSNSEIQAIYAKQK